MSHTEEILEKIRSVTETGEHVSLINAYQGLPISYEATILGIRDHEMLLHVHDYQAVCLELTRSTFLQIQNLPPIRCTVTRVDVLNRLTELTDFQYADGNIGKRLAVRVKPNQPIPVVLTKSNRERMLMGEMADISVLGIGVYWLSVLIQDPRRFTRGMDLYASFNLPDCLGNTIHELTLHGKVMNVQKPDDPFRLRIGLGTSLDSNTQLIITRYVAQRQTEIIREIKLLHGLMVKLAKK